jgi:hypothetical protein
MSVYAFTITSPENEKEYLLFDGSKLSRTDGNFENVLKSSVLPNAQVSLLTKLLEQDSRNHLDNTVPFHDIWANHYALNVPNLLTEIRKSFRELGVSERWKIVNNAKEFLSLVGQVESANFTPPDYRKINQEKNELEQRGYLLSSVLMREVVGKYPTELADLFYKTKREFYLPFFDLTGTLGPPQFPLRVTSEVTTLTARGNDSLLLQRERAASSTMYNGNIYRLVTAKSGQWSIGRTRYFNILDECDYLRSRIFIEWSKIHNRQSSEVNSFLTSSPLIKEWLSNVTGIRDGDFSNYHAGLALTVPIFIANEDSSLTLYVAEGSPKKAVGQGKLHCCPAGMMEFGDDEGIKEYPYETWKLNALKELVEETLLHAKDIEDVELTSDQGFEKMKRESSTFQDIRRKVEIIIELHRKSNFNMAAVDACSSFDISRSPMFLIVDAFRLRPEFIVPIYIREKDMKGKEFKLITNWENESDHQLRFKSLEDAEEQLTCTYTNWAEPGLAAALLGVKHWFNRN